MIDTASGTVRYEHDLRPCAANNEGKSGGGGTFPFAIAVRATASPTRGLCPGLMGGKPYPEIKARASRADD